MRYLVTGAAGFIGFHVSRQLCAEGHWVTGIDNYDPYYDVDLKKARVEQLADVGNFAFEQMDISDLDAIAGLFQKHRFDRVIHLAAQAGVRYSLENPHAYINSNIVGFTNVLEMCRHHSVEHLVYASSSSVYGLNSKQPYSTKDAVDHPVSLYAASKRSNELMAHSYSHLFGLPTTGLRFFTVYGPWGRPDMAYFSFTRKILAGEPIEIYNNGVMSRDLTYIDDIVTGVTRIANVIPFGVSEVAGGEALSSPNISSAPFKIFNIGNNQPVPLMNMVKEIEKAVGKKADIIFKPMQAGDVYKTWADSEDLFQAVGNSPQTDFSLGISQFIEWYRNYYQVT